jgi:PAS domain S-box-containing protein
VTSVLKRISKRPLRILHVEDDPLDGELVAEVIARDDLETEITRVWSRADFEGKLGAGGFDMILCDFQLPSFDGATALDIAKAAAPEVPFIFVSGALGEEAAVEAMRNGATDYVVKQRLDRLPGVMLRALKEAAERAERRRAESELLKEKHRLEVLNRTGAVLAGELDLDRLVQLVTDAGVELSGAEFGAFFYNVIGESGDAYMLFALSGASRSDFERFPMPRATAVFQPTFHGVGIVRSNDITSDPRYGSNAPYRGMPPGHLPVRSYLAVPVVSRAGHVLGGLFFGHSEPDMFEEEHEALLAGIAGQAATAIDNARLFKAAQKEIAERTRAEAALRDSETRLLGITNSVDQMIWSCRADGFHDYFNDRWYEFTGLDRGSSDGRGFIDAIHPDDRAAALDMWGASLASGAPYRNELRLHQKADGYRWVLARAQAVRDDQGTIARWFGTCTDIQEIVEAREVIARSRQQLEREVEARTAELLKAEEQVRQLQKMEAVGQVTGGIAHDFNNMMAVVIGGLNLLQRRLSRGERDVGQYVDAAMDGAKRAAALTQRLLAFTRQQPLAPQVIEPNSLMREMGEMLPRVLGEPVQFTLKLNPEVWRVRADRVQLESTILNLSVNARDAMPQGGRLVIETDNSRIDDVLARVYHIAAGEYVLIRVTDTGDGMPAEVMAQAFDPFFTTKGVGRGTGLGLSQVLGFIRQSGGHVKIYSEVGVGTSVKIYLPRFKGEAPDVPSPKERAVANGHPAVAILVVEDDDRVRTYSVEALRDLGYTVHHASSGAEALALLDSGLPVTLLFTDMVMPALHGRELADLALQKRPGLKVLFTTGYSGDAILHRRLLDGESQVLPKPFSIEQLAASIRKALDS